MKTRGLTRRTLVRKAAYGGLALGGLAVAGVAAVKLPGMLASGSIVYVGPGASRFGNGSVGNPLATLDDALDAIDGHGVIRLLPGAYGPELQFKPHKVRGRVAILGVWSDGAYPVIRLGAKLGEIAKTIGQTRIYQAELPGLEPSKLNWVWQDDVPDARTEIPAGEREPQHRGRTHRLPCTRIDKVSEAATSQAAAFEEMESSAAPRCYYEDGILYFTVAGGGDGKAAAIYVSGADGLIGSGRRESSGELVLQGLDIRYGGIDLRTFARSELNEIRAIGAAGNCVSYAGHLTGSTLECAGAGDLGGETGDGLNGHEHSVAVIRDYYGHDCRDDGESSHEHGSMRLYGGLLEYNGGAGAAPAYGCDAAYDNVKSNRNQQRPKRKPGGFAVVGAPTEGVDTRARFSNCLSVGDATGFFADPARGTHGQAIGCRAIDPKEFGFVGMRLVDCAHSGSGVAMGPGVEIARTARIA